MVVCSDRLNNYLKSVETKVLQEYDIAKKAREQGYDPEDKVDIPLAEDVAERCEEIVGAVAPEILGTGVAQRIRELEKQYKSGDWRIAFTIAAEVANEKFCKFNSLEKAMETGVRVGLAYITLGVTCAPLEGFIELKLKKRKDGKDYCAVYYAGPIRSAGGTAAAVSVLIADFVRKSVNVDEYDPQPDEIKRYFTEIRDYEERVSRLQYFPTEREVEFLVKHIPIELNGDPTSKLEVSNYKRLDRVETDLIRGGMCLVLGEGLCLKAKKIIKKISKWGKEVGMDNWMFLKEYIDLQKEIHANVVKKKSKDESKDKSKVKPNGRFIEELVAGRPVFCHPLARGGFRIRYGRSRLSGLASASLHPATMRITNDFIATGVQLKVERPGKACAISPCDSIKGPLVKLNNGNVRWLNTEEEVIIYKNKIDKILFLGDILFCYGDFVENGSMLVPPGYVQEWWVEEIKESIKDKDLKQIEKDLSFSLDELFNNPVTTKVNLNDAILLSKRLNIPLHPDYTFFWLNISKSEFKQLYNYLKENSNKRVFPLELKPIFEKLYIPHIVVPEGFELDEQTYNTLLINIGDSEPNFELDNVLDIVNSSSNFSIRDIGGTFIGARMGRPEKAKMRKMVGTPHGLFPVGEEGGRLRSFNAASEKGKVNAEFPLFFCENCGKETIYRKCELCGSKTTKRFYCRRCKTISDKEICCGAPTVSYSKRTIDINHYIRNSLNKIGLQMPSLVKGVKGVWDKDRLVENFTKVLLRAKNSVYVNKDGTIRYDIIETVVTHFTCKEIGVSVEKIKELGYDVDIDGNPIVSEEQVIELFPQDVILPDCKEWPDASAAEFLIKVCNFVDDELEYLYNLPRYYNVKKKEDLIGILIISLAPHTSAGIVSRVIGFSKTQGMYAHPYLHAACRRNADGDELGILLLLDGLLNFSRQFLPDRRGGRTMDAPLVLSVKLDPLEIDGEAYNMDIQNYYPLEFYKAALDCKMPWEVNIKRVEDVLNTPAQFEGLKYTHPTSTMNAGPFVSAYKSLETMEDKMNSQLDLAKKIVAVDENDVARLVIEKHFLKDLKGNLRKYSTQGFRCVNCNEKYRRPPLSGRCNKCGGKIILTIAEGSVKKYLDFCLTLNKEFKLPDYLKQDIMILERRIEGMFGKSPTKQLKLIEF